MTLNLPNSELQIVIRKALNEDINTRDDYLEKIKEWLQQQPHLPNAWDEQRLLSFLRACNFSLEKCKSKLDMYFTVRTLLPEFFQNRDINRPEMQDFITILNFAVMPDLTPDGSRVITTSAAKRDFETPDIANYFKLAFMVSDIRMEMEKYGANGDVYILDCNFDLNKHFLKVSLPTIKKFFVCVQKAYPIKIKEVHVINVHPVAELVINKVKSMLKKKLGNRIYVHSNLESLHQILPKYVLPEEFGGTAGRIEYHKAQWLKLLDEYTPWFKEQESVKADESKRLGKSHNYEDLFGLEGSFRQLSID